MRSQARRTFDVLVVGSGASGGWVAKRLAEAGVDVGLLDAGRALTEEDYSEHGADFELKYRDRAPDVIRRTRRIQKDCYACTEWNYDWFRSDLEEPYTTAKNKPFSWQGRMQAVGGRTNVWGRHSYRLSDLDFKAASYDGHGEDWPLSYADLVPYYDLVEEYVGITGMAEGVPELPDGRFQPPMGLTCAETLVRSRVKEKLDWTITQGRTANLTRPLNGRAACHYCGPCERGCITRSYFNSAFTTVADALETGRCTLIPNAMAYKVLMDRDRHRARGVVYIDRVSREAREVHGRVVVLCAQALESVRILLNSRSEQDPAGLGNSSGVLGHYLMDHFGGAGASGELPEAAESLDLQRPDRPTGIYVIRFRNTLSKKHPDFLRGYGFQGGGGPRFSWDAPGFGPDLKRAIRDPVTGVAFGSFGECLPEFENFVEIDDQVVDTFGIPVLRINMAHGANAQKMLPDMATTAAEMLEAAGARNVRPYMRRDIVPGWKIHEMGVARMGRDPKTSVLSQHQQSWDVANLFVMDAAGFPSGGCQNPTLTIMALAVRSTDHLLEEMRKGNL